MKKLRVFVADDHKVVREGLMLLINGQSDMQVIGEADNGKEVLQQAQVLKPDVVVMDLSMPELNGLQATEMLKAKCPEVKVLALTVHEDESYLRQLCKAKADGYVLKRSAGDELIQAIRQVAAGEVHFDAALAGKTLVSQTAVSTTKGESHTADLSEREKEVLNLIAWGHSNKEIANRLGLSVKTVETYKVRVAEKLGLRSRTDIVQYALRQGWLNETSSFEPLSK